MNYTSLSSSELFKQTQLAAKNEKAATLKLLEYLAEVDRRRLYAEKAYGSLFDYIVSELGYSESQAADRVNAVRLMQAVPAVKEHLEAGELTLSSVSQIQRFIRAENKAAQDHGDRYGNAVSQEKKELLVEACLNQSKRDVEKYLFSQVSEPARVILQEKVRPVTETRTELKFTVEETTMEKLQHLKNIIGLESLEQVFAKALDALIQQEEKKRGRDTVQSGGLDRQRVKALSTLPAKWSSSREVSSDQSSKRSVLIEAVKSGITAEGKSSRYIPMRWRRAVFLRSKGQCEFQESSGRRCQNKYLLQIDHIYPLALGGKTELENLRHLCPQHNQNAAKQMGLNRPFYEHSNPQLNQTSK